ncbi:xanthine dehydrogenase accessory protein XdhC [Aliihoeflea aestuarii]|jgi:xanthine dehydrogenase accessory factor|uniref:xanthine dehydrogenase accessory protein XdhC n=1 Tax=Aliihoeflea aestuarii TaxID=453840 RepID=UPI0020938BCB|nr:xanthine dehydrogenase accessory protein XdhC [Aliihoeflea aestuarii]MCO6391855.1 xanthine dehydrogenase accessory protein XdhC [Aliihoeflea aestuarii]
MSRRAASLQAFLAASPKAAVVEICAARGSTPRDVATWMLVSPDAIFGTIGGGQLEFMAIDRARALIAEGRATDRMDVPLGPEIGQCCGGRVGIDIAFLDAELRRAMPKRIEAEEHMEPTVLVFGGGHVGLALAHSLNLLPLRTVIIETRADALDGMPTDVETRLTSVPEEEVRNAPPGSGFVVLTHDHALDFLIVAEALARTDARYVGMIGSKTKRVTFKNWYLKEASGAEADLERLVCPIGGSALKDKRPEVIAALAAAEVIRAVLPAAPVKPAGRVVGSTALT